MLYLFLLHLDIFPKLIYCFKCIHVLNKTKRNTVKLPIYGWSSFTATYLHKYSSFYRNQTSFMAIS